MTKVLVFGAGGVGCVYAWILQNGGAEVTAVCRSNFEQVKEHGIYIDSKIFGQVNGRLVAVRTVAEAVSQGVGSFDYIVLTSKAFPGTSEFIKDAVGENTAIVLAQNGIGIEEEYKERYPRNTSFQVSSTFPQPRGNLAMLKWGLSSVWKSASTHRHPIPHCQRGLKQTVNPICHRPPKLMANWRGLQRCSQPAQGDQSGG